MEGVIMVLMGWEVKYVGVLIETQQLGKGVIKVLMGWEVKEEGVLKGTQQL